MRSIYIALLTVLVGITVSCSAGTATDLTLDPGDKVASDTGFDKPDYIFYDGEGGGDTLE